MRGIDVDARLIGRVSAAFAVITLGACARADLTPPTAALPFPADWQFSEPSAGSEVTAYWNSLQDPALTEFVELAIANNSDLAQSTARLDQARAQLRAARAGFLPQINANGQLQRAVGDFVSEDVQFSGGADASWEADLFGRIGGNVAASRADLAAAGYTLGDVQRLIVGQVALRTIEARSTALQLVIARNTLAIADENLQIARWRVQAGLVSSLDVEQARSQRAQVAASVPALEARLAATANAISTLIGEPPGRTRAMLERDARVPGAPASPGLGTPAEVLRRRPDVRSAEAALIANGARVGVARSELLPLVRLTANLGSSPATIASLFDIISGSLFASVSQLIYDGGRTQARIQGAEAAARGSLADWRQQVLTALEEVETATTDLRSARERLGLFEDGLESAENAAILARSQYQAGLTDFQTLLTAENQLLSARNALVASQAERASAFVRLSQALGGGWSPAEYPVPDGARTQS